MKLKSFLFPTIYSALCIISISVAFYGGHSKYINTISIISWLLIIPFCVMAMVYAKKTMYAGNIGGRDAVKEGLTFIVLSTLILVIFQSAFFTLGFKDYKINFIQTYGVELAKAQITSGHLKITAAEIPNLIQQEIEQITLFKECTSIVFKNLFLGTITAIVTAVTIRGNFKF